MSTAPKATARSDAPHEGPAVTPAATPMPAEISALRRFYWLLRRELWESRAIYLAPLAIAGLSLLTTVVLAIQMPARMRAAATLTAGPQRLALAQPFALTELLMMATTTLVAIIYCLDALQSERRDRSILFWKSMPVSDLATVLAKASVPFVILPLLTVVIAVTIQTIMLLACSATLLATGQSAALLWERVSLPEMALMLLYHMVTIHALWYAPIYAWLLMVSAWSQRLAWLWATLPLFAIAIVEKMVLGTSVVGTLVGTRLGGGPEGTELVKSNLMLHPLMQLTPGTFVTSPGLWGGLVVAAGLLGVAVWLRKRRGPV